MNRTTLIPTVFLVAACGAWCQELQTWRSLPDAPSSIEPATQLEGASTNKASLSSTASADGIGPDGTRETELGHIPYKPPPGLTSVYRGAFITKEFRPFLAKYPHPPLLNLGSRYQASSSNNLMAPPSSAPWCIFVARDGSGKAKLNAPYFMGLLASVALHSANHANRTQPSLASFNSFGSAVRSDAGINVFRDLAPGIQQIIKGHTPKFVSRLEERFREN